MTHRGEGGGTARLTNGGIGFRATNAVRKTGGSNGAFQLVEQDVRVRSREIVHADLAHGTIVKHVVYTGVGVSDGGVVATVLCASQVRHHRRKTVQ